MDSPWDFALVLAVVLGVVRIFAVLAGLWYQAQVTWDRYLEQRDLCADPEAPRVECSISQWHYERGWLLLVAHVLLGLLTALAWWARSRMPPPQHLEMETLLVRAGGDLLFTLVVVILAVVSFRAHVHHVRQLKLLQPLEQHAHPREESEG